MKKLGDTCLSICVLLTLFAGIGCGANEAELELRGKSVTIYPILLRQHKNGGTTTQALDKFGRPLAENLSILLERRGMRPRLSAHNFPADRIGKTLTDSVKEPGVFPDEPMPADYALVMLFETSGPDMKVRSQAVLTDSAGKTVWLKDPGEFMPAGNIWPIVLYEQIADELTAVSDLEKPDAASCRMRNSPCGNRGAR